MKFKKVILASALILSGLLLSNVTTINAIEELDLPSIMRKFEAIHAEFNKVSNATSYTAKYKADNDSTYKDIDNELVRIKDDKVIVDVVGLKEGYYNVKLIPNVGDEIELRDIEVFSDDRSGYAHFNYNKGIGAYKDDGTLKDNAIVVYVNEENKNSVTATVNGSTKTGIANIIKNAKASDEALDIRIIGSVGAATWNQIEYDPTGEYRKNKNLPTENVVDINGERLPQSDLNESQIISGEYNTLNVENTSKLNGLTNKIKYDSTKNEFDSYFNMLDLDGVKNITVEGIGLDAKIFQWGFTWKRSNSIEVKNLTFEDYPEDACSFEGNKIEVSASDASYVANSIASANFWVHNCTFNQGKNYWDVSKEQDKHEGDGATDLKFIRNATLSYNHYYKNHKTGLVGGDNNNVTANITFHHNWYQENQSRMPFARQANMHMYNNYYDSSTGTTMQIYAGAYAFIENCYFKNDIKPFELDNKGYRTPAIKLYNNIYDGDADYSKGTLVSDRDAEVPNGNIFDPNFDTNSKVFYYDDVNHVSNVKLMHNATEVREFCKRYSGVKFEETEETILRLGYQIGTYTKDNSQYYAVRFIGKINFSDEFELSEVDKIVFNFKIYDNNGDLVKEVSNVRIDDLYNVLYSSDNNVVAPRINNTKYFYQIINNITPSQNGYKIKAFAYIADDEFSYDINDEIEYEIDVL